MRIMHNQLRYPDYPPTFPQPAADKALSHRFTGYDLANSKKILPANTGRPELPSEAVWRKLNAALFA